MNKITGKYYIGQTVKYALTGKGEMQRWRNHQYLSYKKEHRSSRNNHFYRAIRYWGVKNFEVRTIFTCYDEKTLNEAEVYFISLFDSSNSEIGYNGSSGGEGGGSPNAETRELLRITSTGRKRSPETMEKWTKAVTGRKVSEENLVNFRKPKSEEHKKNMWHLNTDETKEKIRQKVLEIWAKRREEGWVAPKKTPEHRLAISKAKKGVKLKKSGNKGKKQSPEWAANALAGRQKAWERKRQEKVDEFWMKNQFD